ncbi:MAG: DUF342 domain-containing protein [Planctomycetes bacterium]|nr:DUF342 domain-containing protein [Planctomycetota bacterium]
MKLAEHADNPGLKCVWEDVNSNYYARIFVSEDRLSAYISIKPVSSSPSVDVEGFVEKIVGMGFSCTDEDKRNFRELLEEFNKTRVPVEQIRFLEGIKPLSGLSGRIKWETNISNTRDEQDDSKVDFKEKGTIKNVAKGTVLLTLIEPRRGTPGVDVFGRSIQGELGACAVVSAGKNVAVSSDGKSFSASADGMVVFENNIISVEEILIVEGNVDYSTGNITFKGTVYIKGSVLDGFKVSADKGIQIDGGAGSAVLESGGDIEINGGVAAKGKGTIKAKGRVKSKYLNNVEVESQSDVVVQTEMVNCKVDAMGNIIIKSGAIIGCECTAYGEIEASVIGSKMHVKTMVATGVNFGAKQRNKALGKEIALLSAEVKALTEKIMPFLMDKEKVKSVPEQTTAILRKDLAEFQSKKARLAELEKELNGTQSSNTELRRRGIKVHRHIYGGVEVQIGEYRKMFADELRGPVKIVMDENKTLKAIPW